MYVLVGRGQIYWQRGKVTINKAKGAGVWSITGPVLCVTLWTMDSLSHSSFFSAPYLQTDMQHFEERPGTTERELKPDDCCQSRGSQAGVVMYPLLKLVSSDLLVQSSQCDNPVRLKSVNCAKVVVQDRGKLCCRSYVSNCNIFLETTDR